MNGQSKNINRIATGYRLTSEWPAIKHQPDSNPLPSNQRVTNAKALTG